MSAPVVSGYGLVTIRTLSLPSSATSGQSQYQHHNYATPPVPLAAPCSLDQYPQQRYQLPNVYTANTGDKSHYPQQMYAPVPLTAAYSFPIPVTRSSVNDCSPQSYPAQHWLQSVHALPPGVQYGFQSNVPNLMGASPSGFCSPSATPPPQAGFPLVYYPGTPPALPVYQTAPTSISPMKTMSVTSDDETSPLKEISKQFNSAPSFQPPVFVHDGGQSTDEGNDSEINVYEKKLSRVEYMGAAENVENESDINISNKLWRKFASLFNMYGPMEPTDERILDLFIKLFPEDRKVMMSYGSIREFLLNSQSFKLDGNKLVMIRQIPRLVSDGRDGSACQPDSSFDQPTFPVYNSGYDEDSRYEPENGATSELKPAKIRAQNMLEFTIHVEWENKQDLTLLKCISKLREYQKTESISLDEPTSCLVNSVLNQAKYDIEQEFIDNIRTKFGDFAHLCDDCKMLQKEDDIASVSYKQCHHRKTLHGADVFNDIKSFMENISDSAGGQLKLYKIKNDGSDNDFCKDYVVDPDKLLKSMLNVQCQEFKPRFFEGTEPVCENAEFCSDTVDVASPQCPTELLNEASVLNAESPEFKPSWLPPKWIPFVKENLEQLCCPITKKEKYSQTSFDDSTWSKVCVATNTKRISTTDFCIQTFFDNTREVAINTVESMEDDTSVYYVETVEEKSVETMTDLIMTKTVCIGTPVSLVECRGVQTVNEAQKGVDKGILVDYSDFTVEVETNTEVDNYDKKVCKKKYDEVLKRAIKAETTSLELQTRKCVAELTDALRDAQLAFQHLQTSTAGKKDNTSGQSNFNHTIKQIENEMNRIGLLFESNKLALKDGIPLSHLPVIIVTKPEHAKNSALSSVETGSSVSFLPPDPKQVSDSSCTVTKPLCSNNIQQPEPRRSLPHNVKKSKETNKFHGGHESYLNDSLSSDIEKAALKKLPSSENSFKPEQHQAMVSGINTNLEQNAMMNQYYAMYQQQMLAMQMFRNGMGHQIPCYPSLVMPGTLLTPATSVGDPSVKKAVSCSIVSAATNTVSSSCCSANSLSSKTVSSSNGFQTQHSQCTSSLKFTNASQEIPGVNSTSSSAICCAAGQNTKIVSAGNQSLGAQSVTSLKFSNGTQPMCSSTAVSTTDDMSALCGMSKERTETVAETGLEAVRGQPAASKMAVSLRRPFQNIPMTVTSSSKVSQLVSTATPKTGRSSPVGTTITKSLTTTCIPENVHSLDMESRRFIRAKRHGPKEGSGTNGSSSSDLESISISEPRNVETDIESTDGIKWQQVAGKKKKDSKGITDPGLMSSDARNKSGKSVSGLPSQSIQLKSNNFERLVLKIMEQFPELKSRDSVIDIITKIRAAHGSLTGLPLHQILEEVGTCVSDTRMKKQATENISRTSPAVFKSVLCHHFMNNGSCPFGDRCTYAHGFRELAISTKVPTSAIPIIARQNQVTKQQFPSTSQPKNLELCGSYLSKGYCLHKKKCPYAHGAHELRQVAASSQIIPSNQQPPSMDYLWVKAAPLPEVEKTINRYTFMDEEPEDCAVCCDSLKFGDLKSLECGHEFHSECIKRWVLGEERTCPMCRKHILFPEEFPKLGQ